MKLSTFIKLLQIEQDRTGVITEERVLVKILSDGLPYLDRCYVVRQEAIHRIGTPDFIICFEGVFVGIELKDDEGVQSKLQMEKQHKVQEAGGVYILADSVEPIIEGLKEIHERNQRIEETIGAVQ